MCIYKYKFRNKELSKGENLEKRNNLEKIEILNYKKFWLFVQDIRSWRKVPGARWQRPDNSVIDSLVPKNYFLSRLKHSRLNVSH